MAKVRKRGNRWMIDYYEPGGRRVRKAFSKKKDAETELGKRVSLIAQDRYLDVKKDYTTTFGQLCEKYKENYQDQASYKTCKKYSIAKFKEYFGEDTLLARIQFVDLETYRNKLKRKITTKGRLITPAAVNREMSCLRHMLSKTVKWEMAETNPFNKGDTLIMTENNTRKGFLTEEKIPRLLNECPKHLRRIVICALNTGMRRGEILSLKWKQIRNNFIYLTKTKTNESRQVPINDSLAALLKEIRMEQGFTDRNDYIYTYLAGVINVAGNKKIPKKETVPAPKRIYSIQRAFTAAVKRAGLEDFVFHDLRSTFASQLVLNGASLKDVQELLGHKTMTVTLKYAYLTQEHKLKAVNLLNNLTSSQKSTGHKMGTNEKSELACNS